MAADAELPRHPRSRARPPRRPALSAARIVDAAVEVLDAGGYEKLTMRAVADHLETGVASLYAHVDGRDALLDLVFDRVAGEVPLPVPDPERWEEQLKELLRDIRSVYSAHRGLARGAMGRMPTGDHVLQISEAMLGCLRAGGVPDQVAAYAVDLLSLYPAAISYEESLHVGWVQGSEDVVDYVDEIRAYFAALPPARFPLIVALAGPLTRYDPDDPDARFTFGLDVLLAGIRVLAEQAPR